MNTHLVRLVILFLATASLHAQRPPTRGPLPLPPGVTAYRDLEYANPGGKPVLLDLYLPPDVETPLPLIIWIHGGGWQSGSKENLAPARALLSKGFAIVSVNYRLSGEAIFPAQIEDCQSAVRWLRKNARAYHLDPERFGVFGSSAGGHLVALMGTSGKGDTSVQAVCDFFGPTDLIAMGRVPGYERHASPDSPESRLLGGPAADNPDKARAANPITFVSKVSPPFLIVHGDQDQVVPLDQSRLLHKALQAAGVESELKILPGAKHGGPHFMAPEVQESVARFFTKHLKN